LPSFYKTNMNDFLLMILYSNYIFSRNFLSFYGLFYYMPKIFCEVTSFSSINVGVTWFFNN